MVRLLAYVVHFLNKLLIIKDSLSRRMEGCVEWNFAGCLVQFFLVSWMTRYRVNKYFHKK